MAKYTVLYYAGTTAVSVCLGIALVSVIYPGAGRPLSGANMHGNCHGTPAVTQVRCVLSCYPSCPDRCAVYCWNEEAFTVFDVFASLLASLGLSAPPYGSQHATAMGRQLSLRYAQRDS